MGEDNFIPQHPLDLVSLTSQLRRQGVEPNRNGDPDLQEYEPAVAGYRPGVVPKLQNQAVISEDAVKLIFPNSLPNYNPEIMQSPWIPQSMQKAAMNPSTIIRPKTVFIRKSPTSLHNRSVNKSKDVGMKAF
ncbi:MAG: hypothetical protein JXA41_12795 [Deltaproteobacteria bacterium]|nr:hypothetical protein [Deltaproteobacteria bacterium]